MNGHYCGPCKKYFAHHEAEREATAEGNLFLCPYCQTADIESDIVLCECLREPLVAGEDYGKRCLANIRDDMEDFNFAAIQERAQENRKREFREALIGTALPFRRAS